MELVNNILEEFVKSISDILNSKHTKGKKRSWYPFGGRGGRSSITFHRKGELYYVEVDKDNIFSFSVGTYAHAWHVMDDDEKDADVDSIIMIYWGNNKNRSTSPFGGDSVPIIKFGLGDPETSPESIVKCMEHLIDIGFYGNWQKHYNGVHLDPPG